MFIVTITTQAQNVFPLGANSNVGIGTTAPTTRLQVTSATAGTSGIIITNLTNATGTTTGNGKALSVDASGNVVLVPVLNSAPAVNNIYTTNGMLSANRILTMSGRDLTFNPSTANSAFFVNGTNGNVGLGTLTPTAKLDVNGQIKSNQAVFTSNQSNGTVYGSDVNDKCVVFSAGSVIGSGPGYINTRMLNFIDYPGTNKGSNVGSSFWFGIEDRNDIGRFRMTAATGGSTYLGVLNKSQQEVFAVIEDGNDNVKVTLPKADSYLGIGTTSFTDATGTYRLAVAGNVRAHRVRVYTTWADFVFSNDYKLPTLNEVETHIKENGHLKDIPSSKEVETDGIELGEMNKKLLQKVEELTLYLIQLNKELQLVKSQIKQ